MEPSLGSVALPAISTLVSSAVLLVALLAGCSSQAWQHGPPQATPYDGAVWDLGSRSCAEQGKRYDGKGCVEP